MAILKIGDASGIRLLNSPSRQYMSFVSGNKKYYGVLSPTKPTYRTLQVTTPKGDIRYLVIPNEWCGNGISSVRTQINGYYSNPHHGKSVESAPIKIKIPNITGQLRIGLNMDSFQYVGSWSHRRSSGSCSCSHSCSRR